MIIRDTPIILRHRSLTNLNRVHSSGLWVPSILSFGTLILGRKSHE
jgi:hypothetical protein